MTKVLIGTPCGETVSALTYAAIVPAAIQLSRVAKIGFAIQQGSLVDINQGALAVMALANDFDFLWLIDSDMTFPPDIGPRLLASWQACVSTTILGCTYPNRMIPGQFTGRKLGGKRPEGCEISRGLMDYLGTGMLLIPTPVFNDVPAPWFSTGLVDGEYRGNDMGFCYKARAAGWQVICDFDISRDVGHVGAVEHRGAWALDGELCKPCRDGSARMMKSCNREGCPHRERDAPSEFKQQVEAVREEMAGWPAWRKSEIEAAVVKTPRKKS